MRFHASANRRGKYLCLFSPFSSPSLFFLFLSLLRHVQTHISTFYTSAKHNDYHEELFLAEIRVYAWKLLMRAAGQRSCGISSASRARPMAIIEVIINLTPTATIESHTRFLNEKTVLDNRALVALRVYQMTRVLYITSLITFHINDTQRLPFRRFALPFLYFLGRWKLIALHTTTMSRNFSQLLRIKDNASKKLIRQA